MPGSRTHDIITVVSAAALVPPVYAAYASADPAGAPGLTAVLVGAHLLSGVMFSPDLDLDSAIDDRWGIFYWVWRPYMWLVPHRHYWSHGLILPIFADPGAACTDFRGTTVVDRAGHWVQREAPHAVNAALDEFLATL